MTKKLDLTLWPDAHMVSVVRRFAEETFEHVLTDLDAVARIAMTVHELVENAAKFSSEGTVHLFMELLEDGRGVVIEVSNRATPEAHDALRAVFAEMEMASDPLTHYHAQLRRAARRTEGSGLGLARVVFEGEMKLTVVFQGDLVRVRAAMQPGAADAKAGGRNRIEHQIG
jgi:hypothetical protein